MEKQYDVLVVGGGMAGLCAAISAAREGAVTALIHNRPVLGGNAGSEIRMHICGADYHGSRPNARETGLLEEILLENKRRNPEHSWPIFDAVLWEKAHFQENLDLYLNTHMDGAAVDAGIIQSVSAIQLTTEKRFTFRTKVFVDATGDGTLAALSGADTVTGRESRNTYGEPSAPETGDNCTMGSSLMLQARDMGHPVPFICPFWANRYTEEDLRFRDHGEITSGYWWVELGGKDLDIISDGEIIRDELLKAVYGVWDHIKNGGSHGAENYELEWVGFLPGKRESRRILGPYVLKEQDCRSGARFPDTVAYGGWPMDVHVSGGICAGDQEANVFHELPDLYAIPYRCYYSRNIHNLMMAGRNISCSHMAFASTRVMGTCAIGGQAVGIAAAMAAAGNLLPSEIEVSTLQQKLLYEGCYLPGIPNCDKADLARGGTVTASSWLGEAKPEEVINGWNRTIGEKGNFWQPEPEALPWLQIDLAAPARVKEVQLLFDSNLSREIMITLSDSHRADQEPGTPSELVKDFHLTFFRNGQEAGQWPVAGNYQRRCVVRMEAPVFCDSIRLTIDKTHGTTAPKVYEVRIYAAECH